MRSLECTSIYFCEMFEVDANLSDLKTHDSLLKQYRLSHVCCVD